MLSFGGLAYAGSDPGRGPTQCSSSHAVVASHIEELEGFTTRIYNHVLGLWGEKKRKGRGTLAIRVSSGPIFLTKKLIKKKKKCGEGTGKNLREKKKNAFQPKRKPEKKANWFEGGGDHGVWLSVW